jgi:outer membrane cobalamin receptor
MQILALGLLLNMAVLGQSSGPIGGTVLDSSGAPVADATVRLEVAGATIGEFRTTTDGRFEFAGGVPGPARIVVTAVGFAQAAEIAPESGTVEITLQPAPFFEAVNVTATRTETPRADPTVTMTVIPSSELMSSAAVGIDDALKMVPGFTLFRRNSSRVSNPTSQGIALRGLGGTGASRSLVLADGVPLNDAFGGWVYWDKVPQAAIDRIEVQRGSGSDLYGADAVGGVVQILTLRPSRPTGRALLEAGNMGTGRISLFAGSSTRGWSYSAGGQWFNTDGYIYLSDKQDPGIAPRGAVDSEVASDHRSGLASLGYQAANGWQVEVRASVFSEDRKNGTPAVINATASRQGSGEVVGAVGGGLLTVRGFGGTQGFDQTFSAVNATRTLEAVNRVQHVPTKVVGTGGQWVRPIGRHAFLAGIESRFIDGTTIETPYTIVNLEAGQRIAQPTTRAGGTQRIGSAFVQATLNASDRLTIVAGFHGDGWHTESKNTGYNKTLGSFNPRASFAYRLGSNGVSVRGSVYQGFRAPTLNEFYRGFRVGSTQTNPNEALLPERLTGGEGGVLIAGGRMSARVTGYWGVLDDAITNVTLSITPALITKQRANADKVRTAGLELEGELRLPRSLALTFASGMVSARFKGDGSLRDKIVPQVPKYNAAFGARYAEEGWTGSAQIRLTGLQYEDDQNLFKLRRAVVVDVYAGRFLVRQLQLFLAVENLFDNEYDVGRTPTLTTGLPRAARVGVQIALP